MIKGDFLLPKTDEYNFYTKFLIFLCSGLHFNPELGESRSTNRSDEDEFSIVNNNNEATNRSDEDLFAKEILFDFEFSYI